jgi:hypothetical protein
MPVMLACADHNAVSTRHIAEFFALLGGGRRMCSGRTQRSPTRGFRSYQGNSHYNFGTAPELGVSIERFLDDPMTKPQGGDAAAACSTSQ